MISIDDAVNRLPGDNREPGREAGAFVVVEERGRVTGEALEFPPPFLDVVL